MSARLELVLLAAVASSGCAYMGYRTRVTRGFEPIAKCATGPFEVHTTALGARWGERVALVANTPRRLQGRYEVLVNGKRELTEGFSGQAAFEEHADWSLQLDLPDDRSGCKPSGA
ncbi:MAG TPA: hypothetical protein VFF06_27960, partial [Polyangia bacterium]|nr:hypothetical protein [Polyangia bacterium]